MGNKRIRTAIEILKYAIKNETSAGESCKKFGHASNYVSDLEVLVDRHLRNKVISQEEFKSFNDLLTQYKKSNSKAKKKSKVSNKKTKKQSNTSIDSKSSDKKLDIDFVVYPDSSDESIALTPEEIEQINYNAETDDSYDERSIGEIIRDPSGPITKYRYSILIRDQDPLQGEFSREEMNKVYNLYSNLDGAGLTLRAVSREFPTLTFRDFKRIIRAFSITKSSVPVAPHVLEEKSADEVYAIIRHNQENIVLKKLEVDRHKYLAKTLLDAQKKIIELQSEEGWIEKVMDKFFENQTSQSNPLPEIKRPAGNTSGKPTICAFGDVHFGKKFETPVYGRGYNKDIAHERMMQIAEVVVKDYKSRKTSEIIMFCVGDLVESVMEDGMHPGHTYEMDLFQEEQIFFAADSLKAMLVYILQNTSCPIQLHCIQGNHDRIGVSRDQDKNRTAGKIISQIVKRELSNQPTLNVFVPKNNLVRLVSGKTSLFVQHGDSSLSKKKPSELINLYGEPGCYSVLLQGHWHSLKAEEGTNFLSLKIPSIASTDRYIMEDLGNNNLPGFIIGHEAENCYGFNYSKITLY